MNSPPMMVLIAILNTLNPVLHLLCNRARFLALFQSALHYAALPTNLPHGTHHSCGTSTKDLYHAFLVCSICELFHCELSFCDFPTLRLKSLACETQNRVSRDTLQNSAIK